MKFGCTFYAIAIEHNQTATKIGGNNVSSVDWPFVQEIRRVPAMVGIACTSFFDGITTKSEFCLLHINFDNENERARK